MEAYCYKAKCLYVVCILLTITCARTFEFPIVPEVPKVPEVSQPRAEFKVPGSTAVSELSEASGMPGTPGTYAIACNSSNNCPSGHVCKLGNCTLISTTSHD